MFFAHALGCGSTVETLFAPARRSSTPVEIFFAHAHPKWLIFDHFHLAGEIFLSQRHPERPPGATQGRSFFHAAPSGPQREPAALPSRGAGGRWRGLAGQQADAPSQPTAHRAPLVWRAPEGLAAVPVGGGRVGVGHSQPQAAPDWRAPRGMGPGRDAGGRRRRLTDNTLTTSPDRLEAAARPTGPGRASRRGAERRETT